MHRERHKLKDIKCSILSKALEPEANQSEPNTPITRFYVCIHPHLPPPPLIPGPPLTCPCLLHNPITHRRLHPMTTRSPAPQHHLLTPINLPRLTISPLHRHLRIPIRIHKHIKRTATIQHRQKRHTRGNLPEQTLNLRLYFCFPLLLLLGSLGS